MSIERNKYLVEETMKIVDDRNLDRLKGMKLILNRIFGDAHNQIIKEDPFPQLDSLELIESQFTRYFQTTIKDLIRYKVIIYIPEVTIVNSNGKSHLIKDTYVSICFKTDLKVEGTIRGMRTTFTRDEWVSQYTHSHLSSLCTNFREFCTGTGPINQVISILKTEYDEINFEMLCYHIQTFLEYESIEGTPFKYLEQIGTDRKLTTIDEHSYLAQLSFIYKKFLQSFSIEEIRSFLKFRINLNFEIEPTEEFEKLLGFFLLQLKNNTDIERNLLQYLNDEDLLAHKTSSIHYTNIHSESTVNYTPYVLINFKGTEKRLSIINPTEQKNKNLYYANPWVTRYICNKLARELSKTSTHFRGIASNSDTPDQQSAPKPDSLPVLQDT
jgi:hypothetical protein